MHMGNLNNIHVLVRMHTSEDLIKLMVRLKITQAPAMQANKVN